VVYGDTIEGMDFAYLTKVTALNVATLARIAAAPAAPEDVSIAGALSRDTTVKWRAVPNATTYRVRWRRNDTQDWTNARDVPATGANPQIVLAQVPVDDSFVGVSAVSADGAESVVSFAGRERRR